MLLEQNKESGLWLSVGHLSAPEPDQQKQKVLQEIEKNGYLIRQSVRDWTWAYNMAKATDPTNYRLQLLYENIELDGHLTSQIEIREQQVYSTTYGLKNASGDTDDVETKILRTCGAYRDIVAAILGIRKYGYNGVELDVTAKKEVNVTLIPRTNLVPQKGLFYPDYEALEKSIKYRELREYGIWILEFNNKDLGYLNKAVTQVLFKRFAQSCWSQLCEIYGIPPRVMTTDTGNRSAVARAERMMKDMGSAAWFIVDEEEKIEFAEGVATNGDVYNNLIQLCKNEISTLVNGVVLGQDTVNGNRSKEESSQDLQWLLVQSDLELVEQHMNRTVIPALVNLGIIKPGLTFEFEQADDIAQLYQFTIGFLQFYNINPEWIIKKFGVEVIAKEEVLPEGKNDPPKDDPAPIPPKKPTADKKKKTDPAAKKEKGDLSFFRQAALSAANSPKLNCCGNHLTLSLPKGELDNEAIAKRFYDAGGELTFDAELFFYTAQALITGVKSGFRKAAKLSANIGFEYGTDDPAMLASFEQNLFRFSAAKTLAQAQELNRLFRSSTSFDQFLQNAKIKLDVFNKEWLETEYNTAYLTGEATATYERLKGQTKAFPYWKYKTIGDDKVRDAHRKLDGLILPADDPLWQKLFPPNGWNCRCFIVAMTAAECKDVDFAKMREQAAAYFLTDEYIASEKAGFAVNRSDSGQVFTENQFYIDSFDKSALKILDKVTHEDYGLDSFEQLHKAAKDEQPNYDQNYKTFLKGLEKVENKSVLRDYNNRPVTLPGSVTKDEQRNLEAMRQTISDPNEVWINSNDTKAYDQFVSIRYYADSTFIVVSEISDGKLINVVTWLAAGESVDDYRIGLLIYDK